MCPMHFQSKGEHLQTRVCYNDHALLKRFLYPGTGIATSKSHGLCFWQSLALLSLSCITWSQDIRTALLCYSLLKVHDQAMLTRDGESLVLFSCLHLLDDLLGRNGLRINLGKILG